MKVIFISGKYRDTTEWRLTDNIRLAEKVAIDLWKQGWAVICPHKNTAYFGGLCDDEVWLNGDIEFLKRSDAICLLSNWKESEGAKEELKIAIMMNKEIYYMGNQITEAEVENLLDKASKPLEQGQSPDSESGKTSGSPTSGDCSGKNTHSGKTEGEIVMLIADKECVGFIDTELFAVTKAYCDRCGNDESLYIPENSSYGLLCEKCMDELSLHIDYEETKKNLGSCYPK